MITHSMRGLQAFAADTDANITAGAAAPEASPSNGSAPSPEATDAPAPSDGGEPDYEALLNAHGSKVDEFGAAMNVDLEAEIPTGKEPAASATDDKTAAATSEEVETGEHHDEEETQPTGERNPDGTFKKDPNSVRVNLKDATDAERKRDFLALLRKEKGITLEEAARRTGVKLDAAAAAAAPDATTETKSDPAPADDPRKGLREEIARLKTEGDQATADFRYPDARDLDHQRFEKQRELDRLDDQAAQREQFERAQAAHTQAQEGDAAAVDAWKQVAAVYPDVMNPASEFHKSLQSTITAKQRTDPGFFKNPDWPQMLAFPLALKQNLAPKTAAAPAVPPKGAVTPKKALTPVPPAPAPGGAASGGDSAAWNPERESIEAFLDRTGTKVGNT